MYRHYGDEFWYQVRCRIVTVDMERCGVDDWKCLPHLAKYRSCDIASSPLPRHLALTAGIRAFSSRARIPLRKHTCTRDEGMCEPSRIACVHAIGRYALLPAARARQARQHARHNRRLKHAGELSRSSVRFRISLIYSKSMIIQTSSLSGKETQTSNDRFGRS